MRADTIQDDILMVSDFLRNLGPDGEFRVASPSAALSLADALENVGELCVALAPQIRSVPPVRDAKGAS